MTLLHLLSLRATHLVPWKLFKPLRLEAECLTKANLPFFNTRIPFNFNIKMRLIFYKYFGLKDAFAPKYLFLHKNFFQTGRCKIPWVIRTHVGGMSILSFSKVILCTFPRKIATFKLLSNICRSSIKPCLNEPTSVVGWTFSAEHWFLHTWKGNVYDSHPWLLEGTHQKHHLIFKPG